MLHECARVKGSSRLSLIGTVHPVPGRTREEDSTVTCASGKNRQMPSRAEVFIQSPATDHSH